MIYVQGNDYSEDWKKELKNKLKEQQEKKVKTVVCKHCSGYGIVRIEASGQWYKCKRCE